MKKNTDKARNKARETSFWFFSFLIIAILVGVVFLVDLKGFGKTDVGATGQWFEKLTGYFFDDSGDSGDSEEDFTLVVLPDTQHYSKGYPKIFDMQTEWIVENKDRLNIVFVSHVGDLVQAFPPDVEWNADLSMYDLAPDFEGAWENALGSMSKLDGVVPYGVLPGNHDFDVSNDLAGVATMYEKYFPALKYEGEDWWGGSYLGNKNNYQLFSAGGMNFVILHLEFGVPDDVVEWASGVLEMYPGRRAIVTTHQYLDGENETRAGVVEQPKFGRENGNDGEAIWNKLIKNHCNVFMVLSGHWPEEAMQVATNDCGGDVFEILQDYQNRVNGGNGWLRYYVFKPSEDEVEVFTYSPYLNDFEIDMNSQFVLEYEM